MPAVRTPEVSRPTRHIAVPRCSLPRRGIGSATSITFDFAALPCGSGLTIRSLAFRPATFLSTLRSGCYQTPRKTRYAAAWLRLCRGRHPRRLNSPRLQGATPSEPCVPVSRHTAQADRSVSLLLQGGHLAVVSSLGGPEDTVSKIAHAPLSPPPIDGVPVGVCRGSVDRCLSQTFTSVSNPHIALRTIHRIRVSRLSTSPLARPCPAG